MVAEVVAWVAVVVRVVNATRVASVIDTRIHWGAPVKLALEVQNGKREGATRAGCVPHFALSVIDPIPDHD
jgi:hypothetical protein